MLSYLLRDVRKLLLVPVTSGACFYLLWSQIFDMMACPQLLAVASCNIQRWDREWSWTEESKTGLTTVTRHRAQSEICAGSCLYVTESFLLLLCPCFPHIPHYPLFPTLDSFLKLCLMSCYRSTGAIRCL